MGLEGIVSKRLGSRYRSSRSKDWLKFKNPAAPGGEARGGGGLGRETLEMTTRTHFSFRINARTAKASGRSPANAPGFLDRDEAFALQAFDHSKRRRQQLAAFAVMPTSACDRRLDAGGQELDHYPFVTRLHWQFSRVGKTDSVLPAIYSRPRLKIFKPKI
jgi:hypothetical protein